MESEFDLNFCLWFPQRRKQQHYRKQPERRLSGCCFVSDGPQNYTGLLWRQTSYLLNSRRRRRAYQLRLRGPRKTWEQARSGGRRRHNSPVPDRYLGPHPEEGVHAPHLNKRVSGGQFNWHKKSRASFQAKTWTSFWGCQYMLSSSSYIHPYITRQMQTEVNEVKQK